MHKRTLLILLNDSAFQSDMYDDFDERSDYQQSISECNNIIIFAFVLNKVTRFDAKAERTT